MVGQHAVEAELVAAARAARGGSARDVAATGTMTHAWLLTGPPGSGRSVAALCFAAALQCTSDGTPGCGECRSCTTTMAGTHADVRRIVPEGLSIGVDEMRAIVQIASRRPTTGRWQIVVVEDADRLTEQAGDALLKALEENKVEKNTLGEEMRTRLYEHPEKEVAERAKAVFKGSGDDRGAAVEKYKDVLTMNGDQTRGKPIFEKYCAVCHLPQKGGRIGADLSGVNNKTKDELLTSILNPSYAIEPRFTNYVVTTNDGRIRNGVLLNETPGAITLRALDGDTTILRKNIKEMKASQMSLMPGAFEMLIDKQGMADLIAYLRAGL